MQCYYMNEKYEYKVLGINLVDPKITVDNMYAIVLEN